MIRITSIIDGFRRAGVAHPAAPTDYPDDFFSAQQRALLDAEPALVVQSVTDGTPLPDEIGYMAGLHDGLARGDDRVRDALAVVTQAHTERDSAHAARDEARAALLAVTDERDTAVAARNEAQDALTVITRERDAALAATAPPTAPQRKGPRA